MPATAASARAEIARAARLIRGLPAGRGSHVAVALSELAAFGGRLTEPRTLTLVGQLKANDDYFALHWAPADKTDVTDRDGLVYRYFSGRCFEFHPLANFGALNARIAAGDAPATQTLADALVERGVYQPGGGVAWEYYFDFSGGRAPWLSGMAQAVAAQAFTRAATLVPDRSTAYLRAARGAYAVIPRRLLTSVAAGPWIRLYSFQPLPVLNAQLQTVVSLRDYASATHDPAATTLATRMQNAAAATLPRFDTGYWTYYSLPHEPSPLDYQQYVVQLLAKLSPVDPRFAAARARIAGYSKQPPAFMLANAGLGTLRLWVSKPSTVQIDSPAGPTRRLSLVGGWTTIAGKEPTRAGIYPVRVTATDWAGNHASFDALPVVRVATTTQKSAVRKSADGATPVATPPPLVGAALDDPSQGALAQKLGLRVVRLGVAWPAAASVPDPSLIAALQRLPAAVGVVVELAASPAAGRRRRPDGAGPVRRVARTAGAAASRSPAHAGAHPPDRSCVRRRAAVRSGRGSRRGAGRCSRPARRRRGRPEGDGDGTRPCVRGVGAGATVRRRRRTAPRSCTGHDGAVDGGERPAAHRGRRDGLRRHRAAGTARRACDPDDRAGERARRVRRRLCRRPPARSRPPPREPRTRRRSPPRPARRTSRA